MVHAGGSDIGEATAADAVKSPKSTNALQVVATTRIGELGLLGWIVAIPADREAHALADSEGF